MSSSSHVISGSDTGNPEPEVTLSREQERVVARIMQGRNVFYTGSAGCGKSAILRAFKTRLGAAGKRVDVIAPTNLAALNVGGITLHSYAGWIPVDNPKKDDYSIDELKKRLFKKNKDEKTTAYHFEQTDVLVIDEISMVDSNSFRRLNEVMKCARKSTAAFGGVQMVVTGDVC